MFGSKNRRIEQLENDLEYAHVWYHTRNALRELERPGPDPEPGPLPEYFYHIHYRDSTVNLPIVATHIEWCLGMYGFFANDVCIQIVNPAEVAYICITLVPAQEGV